MKPWFCATIVTALLLVVSNLNHFSNCGVDSANLFGPEEAADFLAKFGWITKSTTIPGQHQQITLGPAIRDFQSYFGLKVTGHLDSNTVTLMTSPRCGAPDKIPQAGSLKLITKRFAPSGSKWNKTVLTYQLTHYLAKYPSRGQVNTELGRAFDLWARVTNLEFRQTHSDPDIEIRFEKWDHGDGANFDGQSPPGSILAHAYNPEFGGDIHFDDDEDWRLDEPDGYTSNIYQVAAHEIGHAIGLTHSKVQDAVMFAYFTYSKDFKLHVDDITRVQAIYGRKVPILLRSNVTGYRVERCPKGWVRYGSTKCFKFFATDLEYVSARKACESLEATLACLASAEEHEFLKSYILSQYKTTAELKSVWIGGEGRAFGWSWRDLSPFNYSSWVEDDSGQEWFEGRVIALATHSAFVNYAIGGTPNWGQMFSIFAMGERPYICQRYQRNV